MLFYFVIFCIAGFAIGSILKNSKTAIAIIIIISLLWALAFGPWAIATFAELILGYIVSRQVNNTENVDCNIENKHPARALSIFNSISTMTITTSAQEIDIAIGGTGKVVIDWGDGTQKEKHIIDDAEDETRYILFGGGRLIHKYLKKTLHTISITGENITYLNCGSERVDRCYTRYCCDNKIIILDTSNNSSLKALKCVDNQLEWLDVSKNNALVELDCRNNKIQHIDLSQNESLSYFYCCDNELERLDVRKNANLKSLSCCSNKLKELDISNNDQIRELECSENELLYLNTGRSNSLRELDCSSNQLEALNLTGNNALKVLHCSSNALSLLDISNNVLLWDLNCRNNYIQDLDVCNNSKLEVLDCCNNCISELDVSKNSSLSSLYCDGNEIECVNIGDNQKLTIDIDVNSINAREIDSEALENLSDDEFLEFIESGRLPASTKREAGFIQCEQELIAMPRDNLIAEALAVRNVEHVVHFTQAANVDSIIKFGLLPRSMLHHLPTPAACNDGLRLDSREDTVCLSIGFPNYPMFYKYRKIGEENGIEWAVIVLSKDVLIEKDCLFCHTNAARGSVREQSEDSMKGVGAFNALYEQEPTRRELGLPDDWPTDAQAEVLVKGAIEPRYIRSIAFASKLLADEFKLKHPQLDIRNDRFFYNTREYSLQWMQKWQ